MGLTVDFVGVETSLVSGEIFVIGREGDFVVDDGSVVDQSFTSEKVVQLNQIASRTTRSVTIVATIAPGIPRLDYTPNSEVVIS